MLFSFLLSTALAAPVPATNPLPTVTASSFRIGQEWIWDYSEASGAPYSSERYRVIAIRGNIVEFEMASTYGNAAGEPIPETPHHRLIADLARCLKAHANPASPQPWSIELLYWDQKQAKWISGGIQHPLAFEEKFNCDPHARSTPYRDPVQLDQKQRVDAFHSRSRNGQDRSWYELDGTNAAVAVEKEFHQQGRLTYRFIRRR